MYLLGRQYQYGNTDGPKLEGQGTHGQNREAGFCHGINWIGPTQHFFSLTLVLFHLKHVIMVQQYPENERNYGKYIQFFTERQIFKALHY